MSKWFKSDARYVRRTNQGAGVDEAWRDGVATPTPGAGAFASASCTYRYKIIGTTCHVIGRVSITNVGTGTGNIVVTGLPVAKNLGLVNMGVCRENLAVGYGGVFLKYAGTNNGVIVRTDNLNCCGTGYGIDFSVTYEIDAA